MMGRLKEQLLLVMCGGRHEYCPGCRKPWPQTWIQQPGQWGWSAYLTPRAVMPAQGKEKGQVTPEEAAPATLQVGILERMGAAVPAGAPRTIEASVLFGIESPKDPEDVLRTLRMLIAGLRRGSSGLRGPRSTGRRSRRLMDGRRVAWAPWGSEEGPSMA